MRLRRGMFARPPRQNQPGWSLQRTLSRQLLGVLAGAWLVGSAVTGLGL